MRKEDQLRNYVKKYFPELQISDSQYEKLELLVDELLRWNKSINLTAIDTYEGALVRHICDSLSAMRVKKLSFKGTALDVGSGAGFPGFVLAILSPSLIVHSIEKSLKKITFQRGLAQKLELENFSPIYGRIEDHPDRNFYDLFFARAFAETKELLGLAQIYLVKGGKCVLWKGKKFEEELEDVPKDLKAKFQLKTSVEFPYDDDDFKTQIVVFQK